MEVIVKHCSTVKRVRMAIIEANGGVNMKSEGLVFVVDDFNAFLRIVWKAYAKISKEADGWSVLKVPLIVYVGKYRVKIQTEVIDGITGLRYGVVD